MDTKQIIDSLDTIFYDAQYTKKGLYERFYGSHTDKDGNPYYKFENETVALLQALYQKCYTEEEKNIFLNAITPGNYLLGLISPTKSKYLYKALDFVFVFYLKLQEFDKVFVYLNPTLGITKDTKKYLYALHEIISLENNLFTEDILNAILKTIDELVFFIRRYENFKSRKQMGINGGKMLPAWDTKKETAYKNTDNREIYECKQVLNQLKNVVYKVKRHRLSSLLFEGINLEVNQDQNHVQDLIKLFGFDPDLDSILNKINGTLYTANDQFDAKACIDFIRSFLNKLCVSIAKEVEKKSNKAPSAPISKMGEAMDYLRSKDIKYFDTQENDLIIAFNSFLSYKGVHSIKSEKEYARIAKNMAIEIGLFLLKRLEKYTTEITI